MLTTGGSRGDGREAPRDWRARHWWKISRKRRAISCSSALDGLCCRLVPASNVKTPVLLLTLALLSGTFGFAPPTGAQSVDALKAELAVPSPKINWQTEEGAALVTYPEPPGLTTRDPARPSTAYTVRVAQAGAWRDSFVYEIPATRRVESRHNVRIIHDVDEEAMKADFLNTLTGKPTALSPMPEPPGARNQISLVRCHLKPSVRLAICPAIQWPVLGRFPQNFHPIPAGLHEVRTP